MKVRLITLVKGALILTKEIITDTLKGFTSKEAVRNLYRSSLQRNAVYLMVNTGVTLVLGFGFWVVVARFYSPGNVGIGSAVISVVGLLASLSTFGFGFGIVRYLPGSSNKPELLNTIFTFTALSAVVVAICFVAGLAHWAPALMIIHENVVFLILFCMLVVLTTLSEITTQVLVALRRADFSLVHNTIIGSIRLSLATGFSSMFQVLGMLTSWGIGILIALTVSFWCLIRRLVPHYYFVPSLQKRLTDEMMRFSLVNYTGSLLWRLPGWILPLMVLHFAGAEANAYFYMAWTMSGILLGIPAGTATSLFAEGSFNESGLPNDLRQSLKLTFSLLVPAIIIFVLLADKVLLLFGTEYSRKGSSIFSILAVASLPASLNFIYLGIVRVEKRLKEIIAVAVIPALSTMILSYLLIPYLDIFGIGVGWLISQSIVALVITPRMMKRLNSSQIDKSTPLVNMQDG